MTNPFTMDGEQMKAVVAKALFDGLTDEAKESMIVNAVKEGLEKPEPNQSGSYRSDTRSKFQKAFDDALLQIARSEISETLKNNPKVKEAIQALVQDAFSKFMDRSSDEWGALTSKIADALETAIAGLDRY